VALVDLVAARALFDQQLRATAESTTTTTVERTDRIVREVAQEPGGWAGITWSGLDATTADEEIAAQLAFFAASGRRFEWKLYDGDRPADLPDRLRHNGFTADEAEALMIADIGDLDLALLPPPGVEIVEVHDAAGIEALCRVTTEAFGHDTAGMGEGLLRKLQADPTGLSVLLAVAGEGPISGARTEFHHGTAFASLWGGGTVPGWRGRGVYRSLVAYRARAAQARGFRYLRVDALPPSEPILSWLGFVRAGTTTPYQSPEPGPGAGRPTSAAG
jgi:hypothetical protein